MNFEVQDQIHGSGLCASRHFHAEVTELLLRIAPSAISFTCIGAENARVYSYLRSPGGGDPPRARWTARLADILPLDRRSELRQRPGVLDASELGPAFEPLDRESRVLAVVLASGGLILGVAGLERRSTEPAFTPRELDAVRSLAGALSLAASYVLAVERLALEEVAARGGRGRGSLLLLADREAGQIIWASSAERPVDWGRDVLPLQRRLFGGEGAADAVAAGAAPAVTTTDVHDWDPGAARYSVIRVPGKSEAQLSRREHEIAELLVGGYANLNIAAHLGISENTVRTYIRRLYKKLKVCNRIDLIRAYEAAV